MKPMMKSAQFLLVLVVFVSAYPATASNLPTEPVYPTGCAWHAPEDPFNVQIMPSRQWGVVPFGVDFRLSTVAGSDSLIEAYWDLNGDGLVDTKGMTPSCVFAEAVDYEVTAQIQTAAHGTLTRSVTIAGQSALMTLTFDDGHETVYSAALPLLESKGVTATAYIVPSWINWGFYMSWDQVSALQEAGWDIGSHSMTHKALSQVDSVTLHYELSQSKAELQARGFPAKHLSLPYGACSYPVIEASKLYYESCRGWQGSNPRIEQVDPYLLKWDVTAGSRPFNYYKQRMDSVMAYGGWYILNNHIVVDDCTGLPTCVDREMLADVIDYALEHRMKILNIDEALSSRFLGNSQSDDFPRKDLYSSGGLNLVLDEACVSILPATVRFTVDGDMPAQVSIYDVSGRVVRNLVNLEHAKGDHAVVWNGENQYGTPVASGFYFCVLRAGQTRHLTKKLVLLR